MNIYLISIDKEMVDAWEKYFGNASDVRILHENFGYFMQSNKVDCVVSPANSFGLMDGGYDAAITRWFGYELQKNVQRYIAENFFGEQPVGSSFIIDTTRQGVRLIHTPTMRIPERIYDPSVIYHCMRTCMMTAIHNNVKSILIPAFGAATGRVDVDTVAKMMYMAYEQIYRSNKEISWDNARATHFR